MVPPMNPRREIWNVVCFIAHTLILGAAAVNR